MSDCIRHTTRVVHPVSEAALWFAWRVCALPAALLRQLPAVRAYLRIKQHPAHLYVVSLSLVVVFALLVGLVGRTS